MGERAHVYNCVRLCGRVCLRVTVCRRVEPDPCRRYVARCHWPERVVTSSVQQVVIDENIIGIAGADLGFSQCDVRGKCHQLKDHSFPTSATSSEEKLQAAANTTNNGMSIVFYLDLHIY